MELVDFFVCPDYGDVADVLGKRVVVGLIERVLVLHILEKEICKVNVFVFLEIDVLLSKIRRKLTVSPHIA